MVNQINDEDDEENSEKVKISKILHPRRYMLLTAYFSIQTYCEKQKWNIAQALSIYVYSWIAYLQHRIRHKKS